MTNKTVGSWALEVLVPSDRARLAVFPLKFNLSQLMKANLLHPALNWLRAASILAWAHVVRVEYM